MSEFKPTLALWCPLLSYVNALYPPQDHNDYPMTVFLPAWMSWGLKSNDCEIVRNDGSVEWCIIL